MSAAVVLRSDRGHIVPLDVRRWWAEPSVAEQDILARARPPVLDVGCGPARHTLALLERGIHALGVDISLAAVQVARRRGAPVLHRSIFDRLPGEGMWGTALLLDGNVGIGGDPRSLLGRVRGLLTPGGRALVEVDGPGMPTDALRVRVEMDGRCGPWFSWARVGLDGLAAISAGADLCLREIWSAEGRWFGRLDA